jgi:CTP:molybdopterin cytidylyltransferase MocA
MIARHAAIVLAAGSSSRLGHPKQLVEIDGETALRRATRLALATTPGECIVVVAQESPAIASTLDGIDVRVVRIDAAGRGMATSLRAGIAALGDAYDGALVVLTDQPALSPKHLDALCAAWRCDPTRAVASAYAGVVGVPALLPRAWFARIARLDGDVGARDLLRDRDDVIAVAAPELARDIDVPSDLASFRKDSIL